MSAPVSPSQVPASQRPHRNRNPLLVLLAIAAVAGVAGGAYGLWYILIGPSSPVAVSAGSPAIPAGAAIAAPASLDGTWNVNTTIGKIDDGSASFVGYRVQEQLVGSAGTPPRAGRRGSPDR